MVRFSDIIRIDSLKKQKSISPEEEADKDKFRLSDSQIFKAKQVKIESIDRSLRVKIRRDTLDPEVQIYYEKFVERAMDIRDRVKNDQGISPSPVLSDLHHIIDKDLIDDLYEHAMSAPDNYEEMLIHTIDVTFTSLRVGKGEGYDTKMLLHLGLAAFLENVGMYKIPDSILKKRGKLEEEEIATIKEHPKIGSEILGWMGERYSWLSKVALQIHERSDGSGYPLGLQGDEISELASIIGLVDIYVAMIKKRPYREKFVQTDAIKSIVEASKGLFPPKIVKSFLTQITLFPVNSYVRLNNRSIGRVISTANDKPLRPTIELLYDGLGKKRGDKQVISLSDNPLLYISGSVNENELP